MSMYKFLSIPLLCFLFFMVNGNSDPKSETEYFDVKNIDEIQKRGNEVIKQLKGDLPEIVDKTKQLRDFLVEVKKNLADGPNSDQNINLTLALPEKIANLTLQLLSTIKAMEEKELLA